MIYAGDNHGFTDLRGRVERSVRELRPLLGEFDSIVVTGVSGLLVGPSVALRLKVPLVVVRKPGESSHAGQSSIEGVRDVGKRYLFLDDFVSGGATLRRVRRHLAAYWESSKATFAGVYMYDRDDKAGRVDVPGFAPQGRIHLPYTGPYGGPVIDCPACGGSGTVTCTSGVDYCGDCDGRGKEIG